MHEEPASIYHIITARTKHATNSYLYLPEEDVCHLGFEMFSTMTMPHQAGQILQVYKVMVR